MNPKRAAEMALFGFFVYLKGGEYLFTDRSLFKSKLSIIISSSQDDV